LPEDILPRFAPTGSMKKEKTTMKLRIAIHRICLPNFGQIPGGTIEMTHRTFRRLSAAVCFAAIGATAIAAGNGKKQNPEFKTRVEKGSAAQIAHAAKIREAFEAAKAANTTHTTEGLTVIHRADGSLTLPLQGRFLEEFVAVRGADGKLNLQCVDDATGAHAPALEEK
jgi:hypothetical protein